MFRIATTLLGSGLVLASASPAWADPPPAAPPPPPAQTASAPATHVIHVVIDGRSDRPVVVVTLPRPSATDAAGAAHEAMRRRWLAKTEPAPLRP